MTEQKNIIPLGNIIDIPTLAAIEPDLSEKTIHLTIKQHRNQLVVAGVIFYRKGILLVDHNRFITFLNGGNHESSK